MLRYERRLAEGTTHEGWDAVYMDTVALEAMGTIGQPAWYSPKLNQISYGIGPDEVVELLRLVGVTSAH